jgi:CheY-like chemotaxis protein/HPt (histidine-containing phosphotransfer) domain-containing protein
VAEDDPVNTRVIVGLLERLGQEVVTAPDGEAALLALADGEFDLVLMDLHMPVLDGLETTRRIRKSDRVNDLPVVALTAGAMQEDRDRCLGAGMNDYLTKPVRPRELREMLLRWVPEAETRDDPSAVECSGDSPDPGVFEPEIAVEMAGSRELLRELVALFAERSADLVQGIEAALDSRSFETVGLLAHRTKGGAGNLGAPEVVARATELEEAADRRDEKECRSLVQRLVAALGEYRRAAESWLQLEVVS